MDRAQASQVCCAVYRRRRPERTPLYRVVQGHFETYLALAREGHFDTEAVPRMWSGSSAVTSNAAFSPTVSPAPSVTSVNTTS